MEEKELDPKEEADETANQTTDQTDETNEEEKVVLSKKEFETLNKKAEDFENSVRLKRLAKLQGNGDNGDANKADVSGAIEELRSELASMKASNFNTRLGEAYKEFVSELPWVNDDSHFDRIKQSFSTDGTETKEQLLLKLKSATQISFPQEYEKHLEDRIKAKVMSDGSKISSGGAGVSDNNMHKDVPLKTEEQIRQERLGSLLRSHITWLPKK